MTDEIRILTLWQPWASLIAMGVKRYETRSWATAYRGKIAIHAAQRPIADRDLHLLPGRFFVAEEFPLGAIVAIVDLSRCLYMTSGACNPGNRKGVDDVISIYAPEPDEFRVGNWQHGRIAWELKNICPIEPIYCNGGQGLRIIRDPELLKKIDRKLTLTAAIAQLLGSGDYA